MLLPDVDRIALRDFELAGPIRDITGLAGHGWLLALVRLHGVPIGHVLIPVVGGTATVEELRLAIGREHSDTLARITLEHALADASPDGFKLAELVRRAPPSPGHAWPTVTVAVCTRNRPDDLRRCLSALLKLDYPHLDLLVVDNAPSSDASASLVRDEFSSVRYVREPKPGLDWARNRAILESRAEIVAYTDDDVVVDAGWVRALAHIFAEHPLVMAVTGLVVPHELETKAQLEFERHGGFGRGFQRRFHGANLPGGERAATYHTGTSRFGTGANMAYRRAVFDSIGTFDPALDVGTFTNGGGDLEMFFRIIKSGYLLVYEPCAMVRHRHRRSDVELKSQIANNGVGLYSYIVRSMVHFPEERPALARSALWWLAYWSSRNMLVNAVKLRPAQAKLAATEFFGSFVGMLSYPRARKAAQALAGVSLSPIDSLARPRVVEGARPAARAVRSVRLEELAPLEDVAEYPSVRVFVWWSGRLLGSVDILNLYGAVSSTWLRTAIADELTQPLLEALTGHDFDSVIDFLVDAHTTDQALSATRPSLAPPAELSSGVSVTIVVVTRDRPADLWRCLLSLREQGAARQREILIVDTEPGSGETRPVVAAFPEARLLACPGANLRQARAAAARAATGQLVALLDDTSVAPADWLESLLAHFDRAEVAAVTGNVLPLELETEAQQMFEQVDGLTRSFERKELTAAALEAQPVAGSSPWSMGSTSNAAFRRSILLDAELALLDETLGLASEHSSAEDSFLFFRLAEASYTVVHEPSCFVWGVQRGTLDGLKQRVFDDAKGQAALEIYAAGRDGDAAVFGYLGRKVAPRVARRLLMAGLNELRGKPSHPPLLSLLESAGSLVGPLMSKKVRGRKRP